MNMSNYINCHCYLMGISQWKVSNFLSWNDSDTSVTHLISVLRKLISFDGNC